jgi:hypothetical protein
VSCGERSTAETPQRALNLALRVGRPPHRGAARDVAREAQSQGDVVPKLRERLGSLGLAQRLRPQVRRPDRVGVVDDGVASVLVPFDRERQPERQNQTDDAEDRALDDAERLA